MSDEILSAVAEAAWRPADRIRRAERLAQLRAGGRRLLDEDAGDDVDQADDD